VESVNVVPTPVNGVAKPKAKDKVVNRKPMVAQLRGSAKWKAWVEMVAAKDDRSVTSLIERAVHRYAKEIGVTEDPPER
jgi:hypothetical protein